MNTSPYFSYLLYFSQHALYAMCHHCTSCTVLPVVQPLSVVCPLPSSWQLVTRMAIQLHASACTCLAAIHMTALVVRAWFDRFEAGIRRELPAAARALRLTTMRVFLHSMVYSSNSTKLLQDMRTFLDIAAEANVRGVVCM
jgi:hypothetical protein